MGVGGKTSPKLIFWPEIYPALDKYTTSQRKCSGKLRLWLCVAECSKNIIADCEITETSGRSSWAFLPGLGVVNEYVPAQREQSSYKRSVILNEDEGSVEISQQPDSQKFVALNDKCQFVRMVHQVIIVWKGGWVGKINVSTKSQNLFLRLSWRWENIGHLRFVELIFKH